RLQAQPSQPAFNVERAIQSKAAVLKAVDLQVPGRRPALLLIPQPRHRRATQVERSAVLQRNVAPCERSLDGHPATLKAVLLAPCSQEFGIFNDHAVADAIEEEVDHSVRLKVVEV